LLIGTECRLEFNAGAPPCAGERQRYRRGE